MTGAVAHPTLLVTTPWSSPERERLEADALNLNRELAAVHGWRVVVVTSAERGTLPSHTHQDGLTIYRLPTQMQVLNARLGATWRAQLARIVRQEQPVLVNAHAPVPGLADLVCGVSAAPLIVTWHVGSLRTGRPLPDVLSRTYERTLGRRLLGRATWVIASSDAVRDTVLAPVRAKCSTIEPGIDTQAARTDEIFRSVLAGRSPVHRRNLAVVAPFFPPKIGGLERYAEEISRGLARRGQWDVTVFTANRRWRRTEVEVVDGLTTHRMRPWFSLSNTPVNPLWPLYLRRSFGANRIDAVHVHTPVPFLADVAGAVSGPRPLIVTYHAGSMLKGRQPIDLAVAFYEHWLLPFLLERADALVGVSPSVVEWFSDRHSSKASIITPGVDAVRFTPKPSVRRSEDRPVVLYVGKISTTASWKGVGTLLEAFAIIHRQMPMARLRLVGDGDAIVEHAASAARLGLGDHVELSGPLRGEDLVGAYQGADVVVLPSLTEAESFGMSLIEAMACATPVVASRVGGIPFVVDDGLDGLLVPPGDPAAVAAACLRLLDDPQLAAALGAAGRAKVLERYTWEAQVDSYESLLDGLGDEAMPSASGPITQGRRLLVAGRSTPA